MKTVHKYKLKLTWEEQELQLPFAAKILSIQIQEGIGLRLWALVDPALDYVVRRFRVFGTGYPIPNNTPSTYRHLATVQDGGFVWHVFEVTER